MSYVALVWATVVASLINWWWFGDPVCLVIGGACGAFVILIRASVDAASAYNRG